jgi:protoporphyrinogen oxidase
MKKKVAIIGAGPAGMTAGYEISKNNKFDCIIYESTSDVGGMARSFKLFDRTVDLGPHRFFSNDTRVNKLWLEVIGNNYKMVNRITRIFYKNKFFDYPLKPFKALILLGFTESFLCLFSYFNSFLFPIKNKDSFESWVSNRFGKRLYRIFFKGYTEKLWGIKCESLTAEFAQQRIKKFSLGEAIISAFKVNKTKHKTLVDQFAYPLGGNGQVYDNMLKIFEANGGQMNFNSNILEISLTERNTYLLKTDNRHEEFDYLISSMPIDNFLKIFKSTNSSILNSVPSLVFRNTIIVYVQLNKTNLFKDQWLYIQDENILTGRVTNFNNWVPDVIGNKKDTVLALEYWCYEMDSIWALEKKSFSEIISKDLLNCGFIDEKNEILHFEVIRIPKCYPVYKDDYKIHLEKIQNFIDGFDNLQLIGRYGSFKYNNQDHSILMGYLAARNITNNEKNNIWDINTDYEYHESSIITETGLKTN